MSKVPLCPCSPLFLLPLLLLLRLNWVRLVMVQVSLSSCGLPVADSSLLLILILLLPLLQVHAKHKNEPQHEPQVAAKEMYLPTKEEVASCWVQAKKYAHAHAVEMAWRPTCWGRMTCTHRSESGF